MAPDSVGDWLLHCHVNNHLTGGMETLFSVMAPTSKSILLETCYLGLLNFGVLRDNSKLVFSSLFSFYFLSIASVTVIVIVIVGSVFVCVEQSV